MAPSRRKVAVGAAPQPLRPPSEEQARVVSELREGRHVLVEAVAGAGKTTTVLHIAADRAPRRVLLVTYSARLRLETRERAEAAGLGAALEVHTYHSLAVRHCSRAAHTDEGMRRALDVRPREFIRDPEAFDLVVVDEAQDMSALYLELVLAVTRGGGGAPPQLCVMGDRMQNIFGFKGADSRFLTLAPGVFGEAGGRPWVALRLRCSYRCGASACAFLNRVVLRREVLRAGRGAGAAGGRMRYLVCNPYGDELLAAVRELLARHGVENVFVLAPSVKGNPLRAGARGGGESPVIRLCNRLSGAGVPMFAPTADDERLDADVMRGKLVVCTFHQSKGLERAAAVVLGFDDAYMDRFARGAPPDVCPNALYVALTRAREDTLVVQAGGAPPLRFLDTAELVRGAEAGEWDLAVAGGAEGVQPAARGGAPPGRSPTELLRHMPPAAVAAAAACLRVTGVRPAAGEAAVSVPVKARQEGSGLVEAFSEVTGVAVPAAFEHALSGDMSIRRQAAQHDWPVPFPAGALPPAAPLLRLATAYCAQVSGYNFKRVQIQDYDWLDDGDLALLVARLRAALEPGAEFEFERCAVAEPAEELRPELGGRALVGRADLVTADAIYEIKCVQGPLTSGHALQLAMYGYMEGEAAAAARAELAEAAALPEGTDEARLRREADALGLERGLVKWAGGDAAGLLGLVRARAALLLAERFGGAAADPLRRRMLLYNVMTDEMVEVSADRAARKRAVAVLVAAKDAPEEWVGDEAFLAAAARVRALAVPAG